MRAVGLLLTLCLLLPRGAAVAETASGMSPSGQKGHLHQVVKGDTLWDITALYLGTPWIWPSIWKENEGLENPHLIYPGDLLWITESEMRKVTKEEAEALLAGASLSDTLPSPVAPKPQPDAFAPLDAQEALEGRTLFFPGLHRWSFVTSEQLQASAAVLGNHDEHYWISEMQRMIISAGEGHTEVGENFTVFRVRRRVTHPITHRPVGFLVEIVGRTEVAEVHPETSFATVTTAYAEIEPGDRLLPHDELPQDFQSRPPGQPLSGTVLAQQPHRLWSARGDVVMLDRGSEDGVGPGNEFIVFRAGRRVHDPITRAPVTEPDDLVARVFVLKAGGSSALALITEARTEIREGDKFRTP